MGILQRKYIIIRIWLTYCIWYIEKNHRTSNDRKWSRPWVCMSSNENKSFKQSTLMKPWIWRGEGHNSSHNTHNRMLGGRVATYGCTSHALHSSKMCHPHHSYQKFMCYLIQNFTAESFSIKIFLEKMITFFHFHKGPFRLAVFLCGRKHFHKEHPRITLLASVCPSFHSLLSWRVFILND